MARHGQHGLWIESLEKNGNQVIYVPTEANLPVLEAGRFVMGHRADAAH